MNGFRLEEDVEAPALDGGATRSQLREAVRKVLASYEMRGLWTALTLVKSSSSSETYTLLWRYPRQLTLRVDFQRRRITLGEILSEIEDTSAIYRDLCRFIACRKSLETPQHRRLSGDFGWIDISLQKQGVSLTVRVRHLSYDLSIRKLVLAVQEIYGHFLNDYADYQVKVLGRDIDSI
jgi:hypothetical protein